MKKKLLLFAVLCCGMVTAVQAQYWRLLGNAGTNPSVHFVGTTDTKPLVFRVNNMRAGYLDFNALKANTSFGYFGLSANTTGKYNTAIGYQSLLSNTTGSYNTASGQNSLYWNISGSFNNAYGVGTLQNNLYGNSNTALGHAALYGNINGSANTAVGEASLHDNVGSNNTATGVAALTFNNTGNENTAFGNRTLFSNLTGNSNTAIGSNALYKNISGSNLVAFGDSALYNQNGGIGFNTAVGSKSQYSNTTGSSNTALGYKSLFSNVSGSSNTCIGYQSLYSAAYNQILNCATGAEALYANNLGSWNTANGAYALRQNIDGSENTAIGYGALRYGTTGGSNTATGVLSLALNTGYGNTANGSYSLYNNTAGSNNTALGYGADVSAGNLTNATAIGANAIVGASNTIQLGGTTALIHSSGGYFVTSDGRFKDDVKESDAPGLGFINKLRPVSYKLNYKRYDDFLRKDMDASKNKTDAACQQQLIEKGKQREVGFIAQEVEKTVKDNGYTFNGVYAPQNSNDNYSIDYSKFVVPLVKSVQELSKENDDLKEKLIALTKRIEALENGTGPSSQIKQQSLNNTDSYLYQVTPNPFSQKAIITFKLPLHTSNAQLIITDATGKTVKTYTLANGATQQEIFADNLASGVYHYSLLVNGKITDSKQMVITN